MLGKLTDVQISNILLSQSVCRLACTDGKKPYVVPVTYAYDGKYMYGQTMEGTKLNILRKNPNVCMQIDIINSSNNWQSVIVFGKFEELKNKSAEKAREYLYEKVFTLMTNAKTHRFQHDEQKNIEDNNRVKEVMYRIKIKEITGRFERL